MEMALIYDGIGIIWGGINSDMIISLDWEKITNKPIIDNI